jgi:hypothetical protein
MIIIELRKIYVKDIYNMDETGFHIGTGITEKTLTKQSKKKCQTIASQSNHKLVTSIVCFSTDGFLLPPLIVMPEWRHMTDWYEKNWEKLPPQYIIRMSDTGYLNDEIGYYWIHHFNMFTKDHTTGPYQLV